MQIIYIIALFVVVGMCMLLNRVLEAERKIERLNNIIDYSNGRNSIQKQIIQNENLIKYDDRRLKGIYDDLYLIKKYLKIELYKETKNIEEYIKIK